MARNAYAAIIATIAIAAAAAPAGAATTWDPNCPSGCASPKESFMDYTDDSCMLVATPRTATRMARADYCAAGGR